MQCVGSQAWDLGGHIKLRVLGNIGLFISVFFMIDIDHKMHIVMVLSMHVTYTTHIAM